jgi:hypothetical protein
MTTTTGPDLANLSVGDEIPTFSREGNYHAWNRYAAVNYEFVDFHMDDEKGHDAGYPTAIGMGNLQFAYLHVILRNWMGDDGRIAKIGCQFRSPSLRQVVVTAHGRITEIHEEGDEVFVDLDVWTENEDGKAQAPGTATVAFPK